MPVIENQEQYNARLAKALERFYDYFVVPMLKEKVSHKTFCGITFYLECEYWTDKPECKWVRTTTFNYGNLLAFYLSFKRKIISNGYSNAWEYWSKNKDNPFAAKNIGAFYINGICSDKDLRITFATGVKDKLVISKNEVDFLFCSTNQSFTSCFKLENGTFDKLKKFNATEGFYITYLTQDNAEYEYNGVKYTYPKMQGRAWLFESDDHLHFLVGRPYGKSGYELRDALRRWLPNGTEKGWHLNKQQIALDGSQYDNFDNYNHTSCHDIYDRTFNNKPLYDDQQIKIELVNNYKG